MHRHALSETAGMASSRSSRSHSFSSDKTPSLASSVTFQMPSTVRPAPAYIAASVASQTVTDHHNAHDADADADADELQNAIFSEPALALLNAFLDHLLFVVLSSARSPSLAAIRPAVSEVLKPRLAREAIEAADEELEGLLAGEDDDELATEPARADRWDVEKVWKRTRLRIMVYTRLGELEDEDEERHVQQERGLSMDDDDDDDEAGLVAWASAIFLTSVIEYVAEQLLLVAGSAAFARMAARMKKLAQQTADHEQQPIERLVIEEPDVEKIALNSALGRLWRTWRKRVRSPMTPISPGRGVYRKASRETINTVHSKHEPLPEHRPTETDIAANIPLPIGDNDVNEIEVPGLAPTCEDGAESSGIQTPVQSEQRQRPSSVLVLSSNSNKSNRPRPISVPLRPAPFFTVPADEGSPSPATDTTSEDEDERQESPEPDALAEPHPESPPQVMRSKRMSIERPGPPGLVRTFSTRSSSLKSPIHTPLATPQAPLHSEGRSYLDDDVSDDQPEQHRAIGVARTSDSVIRSVSSSPGDSPRDRSRRPGSGGYVEVPPRSVAPTPLTYSPSSDGKPSVPERSVARKQGNRRSFNGAELGPVPNDGPTSAPRRQDAPRSVSHGSLLPALQEVESTRQHRGKTASINTSRSVRTPHSPRRSPTSATDVSERRPHRLSTDGSMRSQHMQADKSSSDNSSLKRGASTSSSLRKQGAYPMAASGRESSASHRSRGLSGRMSEEDRAREFDSLVKGQETVKFTLTPESVRTGDKESPVLKKVEPRRPSTSSVTVYPRVNAEDKSFGTANLPNTTAQRARGPTAAQHKPSPSRKVVTRPLARDPKIESESMRDFADFIRSTGPSPGQEKPVQPFVSVSGNGQKSGNQSTSSLGRKMSLSKHSGSANGSAVRARPNMEPRSPAGLSTGNGDLIDFIRQGPPDANHGQPRIPRNVAPFRTTVDSDQFETMLGGHGNVESAYGSAASTLASKDSTQTINSCTGLIPSPSVVQPAYSNTPQQLSGSMAGPDSEPHITRTRRRVKDPYAIDFSDDDDDDEDEDQLTALPTPTNQLPPSRLQAPPRQESLMDFLNGMDPPSTSKPQPFMLSEETIAAARARAASSTPSLSSGASTTHNHNDYGTTAQPFGSMSSSNGSNKPKLQARAPAVDGDVRGGNGGGGGMSGSRTATSDLADFLKNSGPPEMVAPRKEEEKKSKRFWRRGKTYGDLP